MDTKKLLHRYPLLIMLVAFIVASVAVSCGSNPEIDRQLTKAEEIMEQHPDSAYMLLNGIDKETLSTRKEKARYALLMSMALDKNYIDTTTFDVLQPAIDYYLDNGTPDEKLRTYYYKGRIFQNKCDEDDAISTFAKAIDNTTGAKDSLCIARTLVAQGGLYANLYDWVTYTNCYLKAAKIYKKYSYDYYEFDCLLNALNGATILKNKMLADSIYNLCSSFTPVDEYQSRNFNGHKLTYIINLGTKQDLSEIIGKQKIDSYDANGLLNLALGYNILGDNIHAKQLLDEVYESGNKIDTLKYQAILVTVLRDLGDYQKAFSTYWDYAHKQDSIYSIQFERKQRFIEEKHDLELQAQEAERQKSQIIWGSIGIVMLLCIIILSYSLYVKRIKIEHANDLVQIRNLRDNLFETGKQQEEMSNRIEKLFGTRFKLLDGLASSYFECKETGQEQKRIYADVKNSLNDFSSDTATQELTDVVNGYKNGLMEYFKADYPKLSASQYRLALYLFCGFSLPSISIFIGTDLCNIYVYKSRLKSIISKSDTPCKEEYLKYFA
ncbi:hypothetical protein [Muribaculum intestinale]|uniref:hypothetical protein n=1 Tax=Muribaculum intestinale TaxID=1796646 RepID=UPI0025A937F6|nr:hypothetical protein [Muribaculum intestinale]